MKASQRRERILQILAMSNKAISASKLAEQLEVSRQIIVGDIALLRAANQDILSTPRGYLLSENLISQQYKGKIVCCHGPEDTEVELSLIVGLGGMVQDVEVEHPIYGMITAALNIQTLEDVHDFMEKLKSSKANLLSSLTQGIHLHTIACPTKESFEQIKVMLEKKGFLLTEE